MDTVVKEQHLFSELGINFEIRVKIRCLRTHPRLLVPQTKPVYADLNGDSLLVLPRGANRHLQVSQGRLAHPVAACFRHLQDTDQLRLE